MIATQTHDYAKDTTYQSQKLSPPETNGIKRRLSISVTGAHPETVKPATAQGIGLPATSSMDIGSGRKNLFDSDLYELPSAPKGYYYNNGKNSNIFMNENTSTDSFTGMLPNGGTKTKLSAQYSAFLTSYVPDMDSTIIIICCIWYVCSSVSSNMTKQILKEFPHPIALTELQFCISGSICVVFITIINAMSKNKELPVLKMFPAGFLPEYLDGGLKSSIMSTFLKYDKLVFLSTFPMGIFQFVGHVTSHKSTRLIPVSVVHSIKALSPIITVGYYRLVHKNEYALLTYLTLIPLISGVIITCVSTSKAKKNLTKQQQQSSVQASFGYVRGLIYAFVSMIIFVAQNIFAKNVLTLKTTETTGILGANSVPSREVLKKREKKVNILNIDKITISFYCSCIGFLLDLPLFIYGEFTSGAAYQDLSLRILLYVVLHGMAHFIQTILAFHLIGILSPVNYSIANIMKRICVILVALFWENHWSLNQVFGLMLTIGGLYSYDKWGKPSRKTI